MALNIDIEKRDTAGARLQNGEAERPFSRVNYYMMGMPCP